MQSEAEKYLIKILKENLKAFSGTANIIDLGAAKSIIIEEELYKDGIQFICDRSDIQPCQISKEYIGRSYICPLENLSPIRSNYYDCVFANFVLEHISDPKAAAAEMARILKPGGKIVLSLSNPQALEFKLAKITSIKFHQLFREEDHDLAYPVKYSYGSVEKLIKLLENNGLKIIEDKRFPSSHYYLDHLYILKYMGRIYDQILVKFNLQKLMGHSVLIMKK